MVTSLGYNLSSDAAGGDATIGPGGFLNQTGDIRNTDPMLGPLQNNGGTTYTAVDAPAGRIAGVTVGCGRVTRIAGGQPFCSPVKDQRAH